MMTTAAMAEELVLTIKVNPSANCGPGVGIVLNSTINPIPRCVSVYSLRDVEANKAHLVL